MTYSELLKLYREGKLDDIQKEKVEKDIERQDAISEYLFDKEEFPGIENLSENNSSENGFLEETDEELQKFTKMIQSAIRKTFLKAGIIIGTVVIALVCFIIFALPQIVDYFYYDPSEIVGATGDGFETNRLSMDMAVYSELFLPGTYRDTVNVTGNGNGKYDILIPQYVSYTGKYTSVAGTINKGELILYDPNLLTHPTGNAFCPAENVVDDYFIGYGAVGTYENALMEVNGLDENDYYIAYVTLNQVMNYNEFVAWAQENQVEPDWCKICTKIDDYNAEEDKAEYGISMDLGFIYNGSCRQLSYDTNQYPLLSQFDLSLTTGEEDNWVVSQENMKKHVVSQLQYMADATEFCKMMDLGESFASDMERWINNIEEYGLNIYGFTVIGQKEELLRICELEEMVYIYTTPLE